MNGFTQYWKLTDAAFALNGVCDCLHNVEYKAEEISRISQLLRDVQKTLEGHADAIKLGSCDPEKDNFTRDMALTTLQKLVAAVDYYNPNDPLLPTLNECMDKLK